MIPDRPQGDEPRTRLHLVDGTPAWRPTHGGALVRYVPSGYPTTAALLLSGAFDAETVPCLHEALDAVRTPQIELVLLDLTGVSFGDSALVHELTDTQHRPQRHVLFGPLTRQVAHLLDLTDTRRALDIALDEAA
ncbi:MULTISPECIES: STAS domain-containing protein [unclassified Streptomyces]|uniref:STAS domain-containing protein n=1 Tax=unclassified Streptomyces TaxID=2593676 RepID=UPI0036F62012